MAITINFDPSNNPEEPTLVLAHRNGKKIGLLEAKHIVLKGCLNDASEITFKIYKNLNGQTCEIWDYIKDFKLVWCKEWDVWFDIKVELNESDNEISKTVYCTKLGVSELSQIMLYNIEINTETDISRDDYKEPTVFYNPENSECSLLDRMMEKAPHYKIIHVDSTLKDIQKTFSFDNKSIYDSFQEIAEEVECLFVFNSNSDDKGNITRTISVYDLNTTCNSCGYRGSFINTCPECGSTSLHEGYGKDTTIFITSDTLADDIELVTDVDSVKNCFKLEGGDDLINAAIRSCNPNGTDYIWHISEDVMQDMSNELVQKIKEYNNSYNYYQKEYKAELNSSALDNYNDMVDKYSDYSDELEKINSPIIGYPQLMNAYYNTIDLAMFLQSVLMPSVETSETNAEEQADLLTKSNLSPVAVTDIDSLSKATAENAVLSVAKVLVNANFKVKINESSLSDSNVWTGNFIVTNYSDEEDEAVSSTVSITISEDMEKYLQQKIDKSLKDVDEDNISMQGLFSLSYSSFCDELEKYCLNSLISLSNACQSVLDILIEQGATEDDDLYNSLYKPYYRKLKAIQNEIAVREKEIEFITGVYDSDGDLVTYGLQNYIEELKDEIQSNLNFEDYLGKDLWIEFCAYRREDKYSNSNYISDGLNNAELFDRAREFIQVATKEIYKSAELQHSISSGLKNLLVMKEFKPLVDNFEVGNWIRLKVDDKIYKLRLIEYEIDYDNLENISVGFSDVLKLADSISDIKSILDQASSMASSYDSVSHQASKGNESNKRISDWVARGLDLTNMQIVSNADNQEIAWDNNGILIREYDDITGSYSDKQLKIINKGLYVTNDNWETAKAGIGNFIYYDPKAKEEKEGYGVIAETLVGNLILGAEVGIYTTKGDITLDENGIEITNGTTTVTINPNDSNGIFNIYNKGDGDIMWVDADGNGHFSGQLDIGDGNFVVDADGNVESNGNIVLNGNTEINAPNIYSARFYNRETGGYFEIGDTSYGFGDFTLYDKNGNQRLRFYDNIDGISFMINGNYTMLRSMGQTTAMIGTWKYNNSKVATLADLDSLKEEILNSVNGTI